MTKKGTLLVVDDNKHILTSVQLLMNKHFGKVVTLATPHGISAALRSEQPDVVLLDMNFKAGINSGNEGLFWLRKIKEERPQTEVVLFTAYADVELAVTGLKDGAADFVVKPWDNERLIEALTACISGEPRKRKAQEGKEGNKTLSANTEESRLVWGESEAMKTLRTIAEKVAETDATLLITGENGTGKDMLAHEIHALSKRKSKQMITVDMGAVTDSLFESELFGHVKGSFTDAKTDRMGRFEAANGSTLFLDEIANLPRHLQAKMLTAINKKEIVRVGSNKVVPVDVRLICATNSNLEEMVAKGDFREDLMYRINTIHLHMPALRERREDIMPLAEMFLKRYAEQYGRNISGFTEKAREQMLTHQWSGNVRELQHAIEKAVILTEENIIKSVVTPRTEEPEREPTEGMTLESMERMMITNAIGECEGNLTQVAARLGITRQTLYNKMKKFGI